jgi:uncharacterized protein YabE (DUF348 family)
MKKRRRDNLNHESLYDTQTLCEAENQRNNVELQQDELLQNEPEQNGQNRARNLFRHDMFKQLLFLLLLALLMSIAVAAYALTEKEIKLIDGQTETSVQTRANTVGDMLSQVGIVLDEGDAVSPGADETLEDGAEVVVSRAISVSVTADFTTEAYKTQAVTVAEFIAANGIEFGANDWISPSMDTVLTDGTEIVINRITYRQTETVETITPQTIRQDDASMDAGQSKVLTAGVAGERVITNKITYKDGVPINKQELTRVVTKQAVNEVLAVGTRRTISRGGSTYSYSKVVSMKATAYTHTGNRTASGVYPTVGYTVAVDPNVIPLGTMLYVEGYGYARAEDTGGLIKGNRIDVFLNTESECVNWGVRTVRVYVLN